LPTEATVTKKPCLFCNWAAILDNFERNKISENELEKEDWYRYQYLGKSKNFFAVLDISPRVKGDTLLIARAHYTDIADPELMKFLPVREDLAFIVKILGKLRKLTEDKEHGKVYMMSMCEHWEDEEISDKYSTEHLHFHLLPRHKDMRTKHPHFVPEHIFIRCQNIESDPAELTRIRKEFHSS